MLVCHGEGVASYTGPGYARVVVRLQRSVDRGVRRLGIERRKTSSGALMFSVQQKARWPVSLSQDTSQPASSQTLASQKPSPGNREIHIAVPTSRGRDRVRKAGGRSRR